MVRFEGDPRRAEGMRPARAGWRHAACSGVEWGFRMNAIPFATKRAFHTYLRIVRKPLQSLSPGLTAARFDLLYLLWKSGDPVWGGSRSQRDVQQALGVSASVVSRMLRSLEKLGWV